MSMHAFSTLDVDLRQKAPKIVIFYFNRKIGFLSRKIIHDTIARTSIRPVAQPHLSSNLRGKSIRVLREFLSEARSPRGGRRNCALCLKFES